MFKKILVIDDEEAIQEVTRTTLEILGGWSVLVAGSGVEGIALAVAHPLDAILLDVMMPGMDGPRTLLELQSNLKTQGVPVLFLTAKVQAADIRRFQTLGVRGVIAKPFDPTTLANEVADILGWGHRGGVETAWEI